MILDIDRVFSADELIATRSENRGSRMPDAVAMIDMLTGRMLAMNIAMRLISRPDFNRLCERDPRTSRESN